MRMFYSLLVRVQASARRHRRSERDSGLFESAGCNTEGPEIGHRLYGLIGNKIVCQVPLVRVGDDLRVSETAILIANGVEIRIVQRLAPPMALRERGDEFLAIRRGLPRAERRKRRLSSARHREAQDRWGAAVRFAPSAAHRQAGRSLQKKRAARPSRRADWRPCRLPPIQAPPRARQRSLRSRQSHARRAVQRRYASKPAASQAPPAPQPDTSARLPAPLQVTGTPALAL